RYQRRRGTRRSPGRQWHSCCTPNRRWISTVGYARTSGSSLKGENAMKIRDVMVRDVIAIDPSASLADAAQLMRQANVGILPVVEEGQVCGVITDRDLVVRALAVGADLTSTPVGDVGVQARRRPREEARELSAGTAIPRSQRVVITPQANHSSRRRVPPRAPPSRCGRRYVHLVRVQGCAIDARPMGVRRDEVSSG